MAVALGLCAAFGTLMPPIFRYFLTQVLGTSSGRVIMIGIVVCLSGSRWRAGGPRQGANREPEQQRESIKEFSLKKAWPWPRFPGDERCFAYGLAADRRSKH